MAAAIVFVIMILVAILGTWITPYDPLDTNVRARLSAPSWEHIMGTDNLGRDVFSRLIAGTRIAILIGVTASFIGSTIGVLLGVISGYLGGKFDLYFQRLMDMIMAFPYLILAIAIMAVLGGSIQNVIFAIAFPMIPSGNRIARSIAIAVREATFIEAARSLGARQVRIIFRHVLPNAIAAYLIVLTSALGASILAEASLSFLGLGVPPPHPSWGRALNEAMSYFYNAPWLAIFPGIAISLAVFSANLFGDALRDIWDPRLKRV
jgi:peptide/nickel transport system permease protein